MTVRTSEQLRALSCIEKEHGSQLKTDGAAPSSPSPLPTVLRLNALHTCLLSFAPFSVSTPCPLLQSLGFSLLSPGHLISLSFPLIPNHCTATPPSVTIFCTPPPLPFLLLLSLFLSLLLSFQGPIRAPPLTLLLQWLSGFEMK